MGCVSAQQLQSSLQSTTILFFIFIMSTLRMSFFTNLFLQSLSLTHLSILIIILFFLCCTQANHDSSVVYRSLLHLILFSNSFFKLRRGPASRASYLIFLIIILWYSTLRIISFFLFSRYSALLCDLLCSAAQRGILIRPDTLHFARRELLQTVALSLRTIPPIMGGVSPFRGWCHCLCAMTWTMVIWC